VCASVYITTGMAYGLVGTAYCGGMASGQLLRDVEFNRERDQWRRWYE
jgi:hypothetical protein